MGRGACGMLCSPASERPCIWPLPEIPAALRLCARIKVEGKARAQNGCWVGTPVRTQCGTAGYVVPDPAALRYLLG